MFITVYQSHFTVTVSIVTSMFKDFMCGLLSSIVMLDWWRYHALMSLMGLSKEQF